MPLVQHTVVPLEAREELHVVPHHVVGAYHQVVPT